MISMRCIECRSYVNFKDTGKITVRGKHIIECPLCGTFFSYYHDRASGKLHKLNVKICLVCGKPVITGWAKIHDECNRLNPCDEDCWNCKFNDGIMPMEAM